MKIAEIYEILDQIAPFESAESWDNSGLLLGQMSDEFDLIYASLDISSDMIESLEKNSLLITHHPLIFGGLKCLNFAKYPANIIQKLIQKNIKVIAMHTNFDKCCLNQYVASEILGYEITEISEFLIKMRVNFSFDELINDIKNKLNLKMVKFSKISENVRNLGLCTGSGMDIADESLDCFLTGDIKYHDALKCLENGLNLIDITHFESEKYFGECLKKHLQKNKFEVIIINSKNPFEYK